MAINMYFTKLLPVGDSESYLREKLAAAFGPQGRYVVRQATGRGLEGGPTLVLPLAAEVDFPKQSAAMKAVFADRIRQFSAAVDKQSPLVRGEKLTGADTCSFLAAEFRGLPAGTPVLLRKTNRAEMGYCFEGVLFDPSTGRLSYPMTEELKRSPQALFVGAAASLRAAGAKDPAEKIIQTLVKGLIGLIPGVGSIGADIFQQVIGSDPGIDYAQLQADLATIVADANRVQTVAEQGGLLNGCLKSMRDLYIPDRNSGHYDRIELTKKLDQQLLQVENVLGTLRQEEFKYTGFSTFISAATHLYILLQEAALQDPYEPDPSKSPRAATLAIDVKEDIKYAGKVLKKLRDDDADALSRRIGKVSEVTQRIYDCPKSQYYFHDSETNYRCPYFESCDCDDDPEKRCKDARKSYIDDITTKHGRQTEPQFDWMDQAIKGWATLAAKPLPRVSAGRS